MFSVNSITDIWNYISNNIDYLVLTVEAESDTYSGAEVGTHFLVSVLDAERSEKVEWCFFLFSFHLSIANRKLDYQQTTN